MFKMLLPRALLVLTLLALPSCYAPGVPVTAPRVPCPITDPGPIPPAKSAQPSPDGQHVELGLDDATTIWTWMRDARRAIDAGKACTAGGV